MELYNKNLSSKIVNLLQPKKLMVEKNIIKKKENNNKFSFLFPYIKNYLKISKKRYNKRRKFLKLSLKRFANNNFIYFLAKKRSRRYRFLRRQQEPYDKQEILNLLKTESKFTDFENKTLHYCKLFFKYTGSNFFVTLTNLQGDVFFSYSAGVFKNLRTRKEKTTIFVAKELGELLALRLLKLLTKEMIFIPFLNHRKIKTLLRFFFSGINSVDKPSFTRIMPKRKIARNGVRLKKAVRK